MQKKLVELRNGETGIITGLNCSMGVKTRHRNRHRFQKNLEKNENIDRCLRRLMDLGLTPGTEVTVVKSAPFNGPIEIFFRGSRLAIGRGMASKIGVTIKR